jgi:hypothetical protein
LIAALVSAGVVAPFHGAVGATRLKVPEDPLAAVRTPVRDWYIESSRLESIAVTIVSLAQTQGPHVHDSHNNTYRRLSRPKNTAQTPLRHGQSAVSVTG